MVLRAAVLALFSSLAWSWQRWQESLDKSATSPGARRGHSLVLLENGQVVSFGDYACGQLGDPWRHEDGGLPRPVPCDWEQSDELA